MDNQKRQWCWKCEGSGDVEESSCPRCNGNGYTNHNCNTAEITILRAEVERLRPMASGEVERNEIPKTSMGKRVALSSLPDRSNQLKAEARRLREAYGNHFVVADMHWLADQYDAAAKVLDDARASISAGEVGRG